MRRRIEQSPPPRILSIVSGRCEDLCGKRSRRFPLSSAPRTAEEVRM